MRTATAADSECIAALHAESWRRTYRGVLSDTYLDGPVYDERARLWKLRFEAPGADRRHTVLAEAGGVLVGFACVLLDEEPAWGACLDNLHVSAAFQGQGIGRLLFAEGVRWVMSEEPQWALHLWLFEANAGARRFYDALRGQVAERGLKHAPDGTEVPSLRYVWYTLQQLLDSLTAF
jgi:GNAT superfamily N-acetyltransferase